MLSDDPDEIGHSGFRKTGGHQGLGGGGRVEHCEPPVGLGQSTGGGPGTSTVFLIQSASFILNLIISMTLIIQYL